jgi:hypothetical protein
MFYQKWNFNKLKINTSTIIGSFSIHRFPRPLTVAAGYLLFENYEKIQRCLSEASLLDFIIEKITGRRTVLG